MKDIIPPTLRLTGRATAYALVTTAPPSAPVRLPSGLLTHPRPQDLLGSEPGSPFRSYFLPHLREIDDPGC
jgi:hypothetical protein